MVTAKRGFIGPLTFSKDFLYKSSAKRVCLLRCTVAARIGREWTVEREREGGGGGKMVNVTVYLLLFILTMPPGDNHAASLPQKEEERAE